MFSPAMKAVFYILAQAFMRLYKLPADWQPSDEHEEFTGADMAARSVIDPDDNPEAGTGGDPVITNTPADVFNSGADVAAVFAQPIYTMTALANGYTRETLIAAHGWTDEQLQAQGLMTVEYPNVTPAPSTAIAAPSPTVPAAPPATSTAPSPSAPAPAASNASTPAVAAPAPSSLATVDKDGVPWDARIHSGGRTQTKAGIWTAKKGVDPAYAAGIRAELLQGGAQPAPFVPVATGAQVPAAHAPVAPPAAVVAPTPAPAPQVPGAGPTSFKELMVWVGANAIAPNIMQAALAAFAPFGVQGTGMLAMPEYAGFIPQFHAKLVELKG